MKNFLILAICWTAAFFILKYREQVYIILGKVGFAEKYLGRGGTITLIVLFAILLAALSLMYVTGGLDSLIKNNLGQIF